jgi:hypothetical protein
MAGQALVEIIRWLTTLALLVSAEARKEQLFRSWENAKADTRSLVVEFTLERTDRIRDEKHRFNGTFKLLRTKKGELLASYALTKPDSPGKPEWVGLLNGGALYSLRPDKKEAARFVPEDGDVRLWLEEKFNPFALLLDKNHARKEYRLNVTRQDEWYTYLEIKPKTPPPSSGWLADLKVQFTRGRAVFMNKDSKGVPRDMPRQLWWEDLSGNHYKFEIRRWRANPADGPKVEEFTRPEDRPGWEVYQPGALFPWRGRRQPRDEKSLPKVGFFFIVGNDTTPQNVFLDLIPLESGQSFTAADLRAAERRLRLLRLLGVRCSVEVIDRDPDEEYKDMLVRAKEPPLAWVAGPAYRAVSRQVGLLLGR